MYSILFLNKITVFRAYSLIKLKIKEGEKAAWCYCFVLGEL
jgi:hypothetical protein